jgi:hypothetical protein
MEDRFVEDIVDEVVPSCGTTLLFGKRLKGNSMFELRSHQEIWIHHGSYGLLSDSRLSQELWFRTTVRKLLLVLVRHVIEQIAPDFGTGRVSLSWSILSHVLDSLLHN